ncbi:MAG: ABC transporter permease subunit [Phycisphaerales bacterium]|nr:ABC transporter permease subunit [Phycisphaerales bacterium]
MTQTIAIARRELLAYFSTAVGYVVLALFLLMSGMLFSLTTLHTGVEATMRSFFDLSFFLLLFIAPAISMRLLSEEMRLGTLESLMTCPVSDAQVVIGKWIGSVGFFVLMLAPTLLYLLVLEWYSSPDYGSIFAGYAGLLLVGGLYLALGTLASAIWPSQVLAYLVAVFFWLLFVGLTSWLPRFVGDPWSDILFRMSVEQRYSNDFAKGVIDTSTIVYFASGMVLFLTAAVKIVESRRWR